MSSSAEKQGVAWLALRSRTSAELTKEQIESVLRHPLALEPRPVLELFRVSTAPVPLEQPEYEGVDHLHVNLCGAGNAASHIRSEHKAVGLILAELATRFPNRYIFSTADGLALALAGFSRERSTRWQAVRDGIAALVGFDVEGCAAPAVVGALDAVDWLASGKQRGGSQSASNLASAGAAMELSDVGERLWSYMLAEQR